MCVRLLITRSWRRSSTTNPSKTAARLSVLPYLVFVTAFFVLSTVILYTVLFTCCYCCSTTGTTNNPLILRNSQNQWKFRACRSVKKWCNLNFSLGTTVARKLDVSILKIAHNIYPTQTGKIERDSDGIGAFASDKNSLLLHLTAR